MGDTVNSFRSLSNVASSHEWRGRNLKQFYHSQHTNKRRGEDRRTQTHKRTCIQQQQRVYAFVTACKHTSKEDRHTSYLTLGFSESSSTWMVLSASGGRTSTRACECPVATPHSCLRKGKNTECERNSHRQETTKCTHDEGPLRQKASTVPDQWY